MNIDDRGQGRSPDSKAAQPETSLGSLENLDLFDLIKPEQGEKEEKVNLANTKSQKAKDVNIEDPAIVKDMLIDEGFNNLNSVTELPETADGLAQKSKVFERLANLFDEDLSRSKIKYLEKTKLIGRIVDSHLYCTWNLSKEPKRLLFNPSAKDNNEYIADLGLERYHLKSDAAGNGSIAYSVIKHSLSELDTSVCHTFDGYLNRYESTTIGNQEALHYTCGVMSYELVANADIVTAAESWADRRLYIVHSDGIGVYDTREMDDQTYCHIAELKICEQGEIITDAKFSDDCKNLVVTFQNTYDLPNKTYQTRTYEVDPPSPLKKVGAITKALIGVAPARVTLRPTGTLSIQYNENTKFCWSQDRSRLGVITSRGESQSDLFSLYHYGKFSRESKGRPSPIPVIAYHESEEPLTDLCLNGDGTGVVLAKGKKLELFGEAKGV